jgi:type IV conjugative transfer system coupling protein TraD
MGKRDIRFSGDAATVKHHSARGKVIRNSGNFTRGSQLLSHEVMMTWAGVRVPLLVGFLTFTIMLSLVLNFRMEDHEVQLCLMRIYSWLWGTFDFDPGKIINLTLPDDSKIRIPMGSVPYNPYVQIAWAKAVRCCVASLIGSLFLTVPLTIWFVEVARKRGHKIMEERHERGAMLVESSVLLTEIQAHNMRELAKDCSKLTPPVNPKAVKSLSARKRVALGVHAPYVLAGVPYPYRLEQSHAMFIGTTGAGKTTALRKLVKQVRARGHNCVIFDLTGAFIEAFYKPETDTILNPMDERCPPWTIFSDCTNYADFTTAAGALIPGEGGNAEPFWSMAARTLFVEMCLKLQKTGETTNGAIAHHLMHAELKDVNKMLEGTVADPLTSPEAARMAQSIRAVFNTNGQVLRFLPDPKDSPLPPFSINGWMRGKQPGSILFISSSHSDLSMNRSLLTLWMDLAVNALMKMPRTRDLRTWFLFDEVHALHRLPAIDSGLQTARGFGGAFVLGIHSFEKLAETYGQSGAINLGSLARTKLILATADMETARVCSDWIGNREVRQMDEAYSYGYNNTRDASTLTARQAVEPLVIPDDITNLPALHGFIKYPDGFPAARIKLQWEDYPQVAMPFLRKSEMKLATYTPRSVAVPPASAGEGGTETAPDPGQIALDPDTDRNELSKVGDIDGVDLFEDQHQRDTEAVLEADTAARADPVGVEGQSAKSPSTGAEAYRARLSQTRLDAKTGEPDRPVTQSPLGRPGRPGSPLRATKGEQQITFEERLGVGGEKEAHRHHHVESPAQDDMGLGD